MVNCNFERNYCNWKIVTVDTQFEWELYSVYGSNFSPTGPNYGANNSSDYLIADQDQNKKGKVFLKMFWFTIKRKIFKLKETELE